MSTTTIEINISNDINKYKEVAVVLANSNGQLLASCIYPTFLFKLSNSVKPCTVSYAGESGNYKGSVNFVTDTSVNFIKSAADSNSVRLYGIK